MNAVTRLPAVTDPSVDGVADPISAEVVLHDDSGREARMVVTCGNVADIVPSAERAIDALQLDYGVSDWAAA